MKLIILAVLFFIFGSAYSQYYYKDIIGTKESAELINTYRQNKVHRVLVNSYDANNVKIDGFNLQQEFSPTLQALITITRSNQSNQSILLSYINNEGKVVKTTDSSDVVVSRSTYSYNPSGQLTSINITTIDSGKTSIETEDHIWQYKEGKVYRMLRVKNKIDTSFVDFKLDENGNVVEEQETRKGKKSIAFLYYYDNNNRLTDIVRFNNKARRLLPEYLFEYSATNKLIQKITVPTNSSDYLIWRYQFDDRGLKTKEAIYNKNKQLTGKIEYQYSFGS